MTNLLTILKSLLTGLTAYLFWPIMVIVLIITKYFVNPTQQYIINPIKDYIAKIGG